MGKVKIFSIYFSKYNLFGKRALRTDLIEPIQTGKACTKLDLGILSDDTQDNISHKNPFYGELTCWYWVWKNYLKEHPEIEYVGFTQYRRLLQFIEDKRRPIAGSYLKSIFKRTFKKIYEKSTEEELLSFIGDYDLVIPHRMKTQVSTEMQYKLFHPEGIWEEAKSIATDEDEEEIKAFDEIMSRRSGYYKCNFIMKKEVFVEYMEWIFSLLKKLEENFNIRDFNRLGVHEMRGAAFIAEYFFNYWIERIYQKAKFKETYLYEARFYKKFLRDDFNQRMKLLNQ